MEIADRVTVLRRGQVVGRFDRSELYKAALITAMVGRVPEKLEPAILSIGEVVSELEDVVVPSSRTRRGLAGVNLSVRRHEIVGIAGVVANGQEAVAEVGHSPWRVISRAIDDNIKSARWFTIR